MSLNKNAIILITVIAALFIAALVGAYTLDSGLPEDGVFHDLDAIPQGEGSGLDADTLDGLQLSDILAAGPKRNAGCDASNADIAGENEFPFICWNSNVSGRPTILVCTSSQAWSGDITSDSTNRGGCFKIDDENVEPTGDARIFFKGTSNDHRWNRGELFGCAITTSDIEGEHELGFACSGSEGVLACTVQMEYDDAHLSKLACITGGWRKFKVS